MLYSLYSINRRFGNIFSVNRVAGVWQCMNRFATFLIEQLLFTQPRTLTSHYKSCCRIIWTSRRTPPTHCSVTSRLAATGCCRWGRLHVTTASPSSTVWHTLATFCKASRSTLSLKWDFKTKSSLDLDLEFLTLMNCVCADACEQRLLGPVEFGSGSVAYRSDVTIRRLNWSCSL